MRIGNHFEIEICFIRHGKTRANELKQYVSCTDLSLSENGRNEIIGRARAGYYDFKPQQIFTSGYRRTMETAEICFADALKEDRSIIISDSRLAEIDFGDFEGKTYEELKDNEDYRAWLESGGCSKIPGGESKAEFIARELEAFTEILSESRNLKRIAVAAHGGTIMAVLSTYTSGDYFSFHTEPGERIDCRVKFGVEGDRLEVTSFGITHRDNT